VETKTNRSILRNEWIGGKQRRKRGKKSKIDGAGVVRGARGLKGQGLKGREGRGIKN